MNSRCCHCLPRFLLAALAWLHVLGASATAAAPQEVQEPPGPSFREVLSLKSVGAPRVAPGGRMIAYTVRTTDWEENRYDQEIWLFREGEEPFQLTRTKDGSSTGQRWSPDRYAGFVQFGMWLLRPRAVEEFRGWMETVASAGPPRSRAMVSQMGRPGAS